MAIAPPQQPKTLRQRFMELPEKIRDWLASERATYAIIEINQRLGLFGIFIEIIPRLVLRLVVKDLNPDTFITALSKELDIDLASAKTIAQEIEEKILRPVAPALLREAGVDIKLIYGVPAAGGPSRVGGLPPLRVPSAIRQAHGGEQSRTTSSGQVPSAGSGQGPQTIPPKPPTPVMRVPINKGNSG